MTQETTKQDNVADETPKVERNSSPAMAEITYDDFAKVQLRVAQVLSAERIEKSEKLLKLQVTLGSEFGERQIIAGIAKHYTPEEMLGRKIIVVANLKPAKLMGELSQGMLLAASDETNHLELVSPGTLVSAGGVVR